MKKLFLLGCFSIALVACGSSSSDKDYLLGLISDAETKIVSCKDEGTSDAIGECLNNAMKTLQTEWKESMQKLSSMDEKDAEEVGAAYTKLSMTIQQELMQIMMKQMPVPE